MSLDKVRILEVISGLSGWEFRGLERLGGGRNSRVYKATVAGGEEYCLKEYFSSESDTRDRIGVESAAFECLSRLGFDNVPEVYFADRDSGLALYSFFSGKKLEEMEIGSSDIDSLAGFIGSLQSEIVREKFRDFDNAADASFSLNEIFDDIESRISRFWGIEPVEPHFERFLHFFNNRLLPYYSEQKSQSIGRSRANDGSEDIELAGALRILSPSDYGFHNAVCDSERRLRFFDFEYFGWDSPEKCINDFRLHPGFSLSSRLRERFRERVEGILNMDKTLSFRVDNTYNLYGVKWCLIILNVFCTADLQRRIFSEEAGIGELLDTQLAKAEKFLARLMNKDG